MYFDKEWLDKLKEETNLKDLVEEYSDTVLKKAGVNRYMGHCPHPDHNDSDASFYVDLNKNTWCCYGCHSDRKNTQEGNYGSDCIALLQWLDNNNHSWSYYVKELASRINLPLPEEKHQEVLKKNYKICMKYYNNMTDEAYDYIYDRGVDNDTLDKWYIGFDSYDNRIVFPLLDSYGNVLGFNKRLIDAKTKGVKQKYIHSSNSDVFEKSKYIYGLNHIDKNADYIILTEGVFDVILPQQFGVKNTICALGTTLSDYQIDLLARYNKLLIIAYDCDEKGQKTLKKIIPQLQEAGINTKVLPLPEEKDLADLSLQLKDNLLDYIMNNAITYAYYQAKEIINDYNKELFELNYKYTKLMKSIDYDINDKEFIETYIQSIMKPVIGGGKY